MNPRNVGVMTNALSAHWCVSEVCVCGPGKENVNENLNIQLKNNLKRTLCIAVKHLGLHVDTCTCINTHAHYDSAQV